MDTSLQHTKAKSTQVSPLILYLGLTLVFSTVFWILIASAGELTPTLLLGLMWSPGAAAILIRQLRHEETEPLGWRPGRLRYLLLGYLLPPFVFVIAYGIAWLTRWVPILPEQASAVLTARFWITWVIMTIGALLSAMGEEIGWRGMLVPLLNKRYGFGLAVLFSGLIWSAWHYPMMMTVGYSVNDTPAWYAIIVFTVTAVGFSVFLGWLRLRSDNLWPAALAHASFNLAQTMLGGMTATNGVRGYLVGESGILLAGTMGLVAFIFWLLRRSVSTI